jgi:hypothetical protein
MVWTMLPVTPTTRAALPDDPAIIAPREPLRLDQPLFSTALGDSVEGPNEYNSQHSAPGSDPTASVSPKHTENSKAFSGATPKLPSRETTANKPQPLIEIGTIVADHDREQDRRIRKRQAEPCARPSDQTRKMVST